MNEDEKNEIIDFQERLSIERMIFSIDSKIINTQTRMVESYARIRDLKINAINDWLEKHNDDRRYMLNSDRIGISRKALHKIDKIISDDQKKTKTKF